MKKFILTENQLKKIIQRVINEQSEESLLTQAVQCFLNKTLKPSPNLKVDGYVAKATTEAIRKFQLTKDRIDTDGVWGGETANSMSPQELSHFKQCISDTGGLFDKIFHFLGLD